MHTDCLEAPTPSLVGWARTARPIAYPSKSPASRTTPMPEVETVDDALFGASVLALLVAVLGAVVTMLV